MYDFTRIYIRIGKGCFSVSVIDLDTEKNLLCNRHYKNVTAHSLTRLFSFVCHRAIDLHTQQTESLWFDWGDSARWHKYKNKKI